MTQTLRLRTGEIINVSEREWELLRDAAAAVVRVAEAYDKLPATAKDVLHDFAAGSRCVCHDEAPSP